ncbi:cyclin-like protein [Geopyxis carbonaria]|nr:cyclin-like protein [Geopyxis carbonaria]
MPATCPGCGSSNPGDFDDSSGTLVCTQCGGVVNDSFIVSEVQFGENSSGAAIVQGSFVGHGQTHANTGGRYRSGNSIESREQTIAEGRRIINQLAAILNCPDYYAESAQRWYTLAVTNNFTRGRKTRYVVACCLYITCRMEKSSHMLIDFSDTLHINVFMLGHTYLKLVNVLNVKMPLIDPAVYVHRFAKHLDFGSEQHKVAKDALRLIQRMDRDWIVAGRRPSGICGAALVLAARMNNFRRTVREVVYVVKVADLTINKRLKEFKDTKSGELTVEEFRSIWLEQYHDPPSFGPKTKKRRRVRQVNDEGEAKRHAATPTASSSPTSPPPQSPSTPCSSPPPPPPTAPPTTPSKTVNTTSDDTPEAPEDTLAISVMESEITTLMSSSESIAAALQASLASLPPSTVSDDPTNLDDVDSDIEVQSALLAPAEAQLKERIWTEFNKDWLRDQEVKRLRRIREDGEPRPKKRRRSGKPRDSASKDLAASPAESATEMLKRRAYSKKINYKAIEGLFD